MQTGRRVPCHAVSSRWDLPCPPVCPALPPCRHNLHALLQRVAEALNLPLLGRGAAVVAVVAKVLHSSGVEAAEG